MVVLDPLYGEIEFDRDVSSLISKPLVQRLRHVRLSNIDSLDLPGVGHISRYEHVLGTSFLATQLPFASRLSHQDRLILLASALLHDWAITAFGHLVEESFRYVGVALDHQNTLFELITQDDSLQLGGEQRQILCGRQTKLREWSIKAFGSAADDALRCITESIQGRGPWGKIISGEIDLDNIDNVYRAALHMGLNVSRERPLHLARAMADCTNGCPVFDLSAEGDIEDWLQTRWNVYQHFMLAERDFAGKLMLIYATVRSLQNGDISKGDWALTDIDLITQLRSSPNRETRDAVERWLVGELWAVTPLFWVCGEHPSFPKLLDLSLSLSKRLNRTCFAYGIKDKRQRELSIHFADGSTKRYGQAPRQWLFGVGSPTRRDFTTTELQTVLAEANAHFQAASMERAKGAPSRNEAIARQMWLI